MHLLVEVLRAGAEHELLVDLHVELGALRLQLPATCRRPRIRALQENREKQRLVRVETINPVSEWAITPVECGFQFAVSSTVPFQVRSTWTPCQCTVTS